MTAARKATRQDHNDLTTETISRALSFVPSHERDTWVRMAMALKSELGDEGFAAWDAWSRAGDNYSERDARHVWKSTKPSGGVGIGTLIYAAQQNGFRFSDADDARLSDEQAAERKRQQEAMRAKAAAEERARQAQAAASAQELWDAAAPADESEHPYLERKGVRAYGLRIGRWPLRNKEGEIYGHADNVLLIPMHNGRGTLTSLQGIFGERPKGYEGDKSYLKGGKKAGSHFVIGEIDQAGPNAVAEGYATAATIHEVTGWPVVVCFDSGNMQHAAEWLRKQAPNADLVVCGDNDRHTEGNPGAKAARAAAFAIRGRAVLPTFADEDTTATDFNDLYALVGGDVVLRQLGAARKIEPPATREAANDSGSQDDEPFRILGYDHGMFFIFQKEKQQLVRMTKSDMTETGFLEIAPLNWWMQYFPKQQGFDKKTAADWLIRESYRAGIYDPSRIRGRGAWVDNGRVVFHFGSHLWVEGVTMPVTQIRSTYVYELDRSLAKPAADSLTDAEGMHLVETAEMFRWTKPASAALLSGFVALAPLCGALRWRPHVWITGGAGCGKTTVLNEYVHRLLGGLNLFAQGNSTEAGIRQALRSDALPVLFDESEQNNDREVGRVQNVLSLIRQASSESAAKTLKGTAGGEAMHFIIRSMFCLSSIQVGMKHQADIERLTVLALRPKREDPNAARTWATLKDRLYVIERDETLSGRVLRRSLDLLPTTLQNIRTFVDAASRKFGSVREGDQYGTLLAGCWSLMRSDLATPEEAAALIDAYDWSEYRENLEMDESSLALGALLEAQLRIHGGGTVTVYEAIMIAENGSSALLTQAEADTLLQRYGMRVAGKVLLLSNNSQALTDMLRNTPYAADWRGQLLRAPGVQRHDKSVRFNGTVSKCIAVPLAALRDEPADDRPF